MPAYHRADRARLSTLPVIDKSKLMARFADYNRLGLTADDGWRVLASGGRHGRYFVGASTGTSGNQGLYVISEVERWRWLGTMLAKTMPRLRKARVALALPLDTSLYDTARRSFLEFRFFDLKLGVEACCEAVAAFDPDTVIAPPKVLRLLANGPGPLTRLSHIFSAGEVLDPLDRQVIEQTFGTIVGQIYMATEGLLGVSCEHGTLHLSEDTMAFEFEPVSGSPLVTPIITDFCRETQGMVRYRLNDLLLLSEAACPCGSPLRAVAQVEGRMDDLLLLPVAGGERLVTPDILRNAIVSADRRITDFRLVQTERDAVVLSLLDSLPADAVDRARGMVAALFRSLGIEARVEVTTHQVLDVSSRKLRRVERRWHP
jgi:putative adenylate-forming enzyme